MVSFWRKSAENDPAARGHEETAIPGESFNDSIAKIETLYRMDWERDFRLGMERVWEALSREDEITSWMKFPTKLEPRVGGLIHIDFSSQGSLEGIICNFEPPRLLAYTWGDSLVNWKLEGDQSATRLRLSHIGVHPELAAGLGAGWHGFLGQMEEYLTGAPKPDNYRELKDRYEKEIEP